MLDPVVNQYVRVRFSELGEGVGPSLEATEEESSEVRRTYLVGTAARPVIVEVEGPAWLRVDELRGSDSRVSYREVPPGWNRLEFRPAAERDEGLFRIFARGPRVPDPQEPHPDADPGPRIAVPTSADPSRPPPERLHLVDAFECEDHEDGSFALGISLNRKKMFDEDETQNFDEYVQIDATHRYLADRETAHFETRALWRMHSDAGPTVGFEEDIHYRPSWLPATLRLSGTAYVQWPDAPAVLPQNHPEWAGTLRGSLSRVFSLGFGAWHLPGVAVFGRHVSLDDAARYPTKTLDPDVYSQYKRDHSNGVVFSETVGYRPWFDAEAWAKASLTSNEDFDLGPPDQVALSAGWKQFWAGFEANLGYRATYFFADRDREDSILRNGPFVKLGYDLWTGPRDRLEFTIDYLHEFPNNADIGFVGVTWHFSGGRAYRDYWPGEVDFRSLKEERYHRRWENALAESGSE
jgi:hypothetical protein